MDKLTESKRVVIENVKPEIEGGRFPVKRVVGGKVTVEADIFTDGHDKIAAKLFYMKAGDEEYSEKPMEALVNDRWRAEFTVDELGYYRYGVKAWIDHFNTYRADLEKKRNAGQDLEIDLLVGADLLEDLTDRASDKDAEKLRSWAEEIRDNAGSEDIVELVLSEEVRRAAARYPEEKTIIQYDKELPVLVEREKAGFSAWYELFPRSWGEGGEHGTFKDCEKHLPEIARLGFDVLYLPPIHPIGETNRKGKNNDSQSKPGDPGSPWAVGSKEGGHKAIHPKLGTMDDFKHLIKAAGEYNIEVAMDLAFQCSRDHPYLKDHPEWFKWSPDGSIQFAENPPKKYEDIVPINFETENWRQLWEELKSIVLFWIDKGIRIFRVDNPHTKPFFFWEWLINEIKREHPDVFFLSEAFTRPKVMKRLAKAGFSQSYTYFTWRNSKKELTEYLEELTKTETSEYFRPNFWPNTPDILPEYLQHDGRAAFIIRFILAATLSSNFGVYGPAYELCINEALPEREEYVDSEKYEIKDWDWDQPGNIKEIIRIVNRARNENKALQETANLRFYEVDNDYILFYGKTSEDLSNIILVAANLDPFHKQCGWIRLPLDDFGLDHEQPYLVYDIISQDKFFWQGERNYVELDPYVLPAHILRIHTRVKREQDFDYFM